MSPSASILAGSPDSPVPAPDLEPAIRAARRAREVASPEEVAAALGVAAGALRSDAEGLAALITGEIGKPVTLAAAEVERAARLLELAARLSRPPDESTPEALLRRRPLGTVALLTPGNNPLAIPAGKLAPALALGNAVVWKPHPQAAGVARALVTLLASAGLPEGLLGLIEGGAPVGADLMAAPGIDAVSITGSSTAGAAAQAACAARRIPLQAELGGNNGVIVWDGADLADAGARIASAAFGAAGQRCTATRRVIYREGHASELVARLREAALALPNGSPTDPATVVGPLADRGAAQRVRAQILRARDLGHEVEALAPLPGSDAGWEGHWVEPTLVRAPDPSSEIVQRESFGPVLVLQPAMDFDHAIELLNGVGEGLVAALFSPDPAAREQFLSSAAAGVLKLDLATADVGVETPFGGWKRSGIGPPEHGAGNVEFYTRRQAVYGA